MSPPLGNHGCASGPFESLPWLGTIFGKLNPPGLLLDVVVGDVSLGFGASVVVGTALVAFGGVFFGLGDFDEEDVVVFAFGIDSVVVEVDDLKMEVASFVSVSRLVVMGEGFRDFVTAVGVADMLFAVLWGAPVLSGQMLLFLGDRFGELLPLPPLPRSPVTSIAT